jgi:AsmA protein
MRRAAIVLLSIVAVLIVVVLTIPLFLNANQFRPQIESDLSKSLGRPVRIGDLSLSVFSGKVTARDLSIADDPAFSQAPFVTAKSIAFTVALFEAVFQHRLNISAIDAESPQIVLIQMPSGVWNFSSMGAKSAPQVRPVSENSGNMALTIKSLNINNGQISINTGTKPEVLNNVAVQINNFAPAASFPFSLSGKVQGGGDLAITGQAGPINDANAANTPLNANIKITKLNLLATGTVPPGSGIDGLLSADANATSNGRTFHMTGKITGESLKLARGAIPTRKPLFFDVDMTEDLAQHTGQMTQGNVAIGGVKAALTGTWVQRGPATDLKMLFAAPGVPVSGVEDLLPALGIMLPSGATLEGGTASANLEIAGPSNALVISGPVSVQNTRLRNFDLGSKLAPIEQLAGMKSGPNTEIQTLSTDLRIAPDVTSLGNIRAVVPSIGELTGAGTISKSQALAFNMRAVVHGGGLISTKGSATIPFTIEGTSSNPQFRPDVGQIAAQQLQQRLKGVNVDGVNVGQAAGGVLGGLLGGKKKK